MQYNIKILSMVVIMRWTSVLDCFCSFVILYTLLKTVTSMKKDKSRAKIVSILSHRAFLSDIEKLYLILRLLSYAVLIILNRTASLIDSYLILAFLYGLMLSTLLDTWTKWPKFDLKNFKIHTTSPTSINVRSTVKAVYSLRADQLSTDALPSTATLFTSAPTHVTIHMKTICSRLQFACSSPSWIDNIQNEELV